MSTCKSSKALVALLVLKGKENLCCFVCGHMLQMVKGPLQDIAGMCAMC